MAGLLLAVRCLSLICTVISVDDGLLSNSIGCAIPFSSLTLYDDSLKVKVIAGR